MKRLILAWAALVPLQSATTTPTNPIDAHFEACWKREGLQPSAPADDLEFLRRVHLDLAGRLPTVEEIRAFQAEPKDGRRDRLVDRLLLGEEHAIFFADAWLWMLIDYDMAPRDVLRVDFAGFRGWLRSRFYEDRPYDETVRALLSDRGARREKPAVNFGLKHLADEPLPVKMATISARLFLGKDIRCAQCHDHPFEAMTQDEFWGYLEFFRPLRNANDEALVERGSAAGPVRMDLGEIRGQPARFLDGRTPEAGRPLGEALADFVLSTKERDCSRAAVNRFWKHFFGRWLVAPKDKTPEHAALLESLVSEFERTGRSLRKLMRTIVTSSAYQRGSAGAETARIGYAAGPVKPMGAVQFLNVVADVFNLHEAFRMMREKAYADPKFEGLVKDADTQRMQFIQWGRDLMIPKGHDPEEAPAIGTVRMAVKFMNNRKINSMMIAQWGILKKVLSKRSRPADRVEELYLALLTRPPTAEERLEMVAYVEESSDASKAFEDLLWVLVNSSEFLFNH